MEHPAFTLAGVCTLTGGLGYIRNGSVPMLAAGIGIGGLYGYSGKFIRENADYGLEGAILASTLLTARTLPRAVRVRRPVPIALSVAGVAALAYYSKKWSDFYL